MQEDGELLRMAAFKLKEAARRLNGLAREAKAPESRARLDALADELCDREAQLWALLEERGEGRAPDNSGDSRPRNRAPG